MTRAEQTTAPTMPPSASELTALEAYETALRGTSISFLALVRCPPSAELAASFARFAAPAERTTL